MRVLYGLFVATIGFTLWLSPYALGGYGLYVLYGKSWFGLAFLAAAIPAFFVSRSLAGPLVNVGDMIVTQEQEKQKSEEK